MNNQSHYSTLEPVVGHSNQPGLEATADHIPSDVLHKNEYDNFPIEGTAGKDEKKIFGLKRRLFFIVAGLLALLVVGAIVGGVVGGTRPKSKAKSNPETSEPTPTPSTQPPTANNTAPPSESNLMEGSQLASANWTDSKKNQHHAVFYQNKTGGLMASLWDSQNQSWVSSTVSIPTLQIDPVLNGTAIAADVKNHDFQLNVYFYTTTHKIVEFYTKDQQARTWSEGTLTDKAHEGHAGSKLAAYFQKCDSPKCSNATVLTYQDPNQNVRYANSSDWSKVGYVFKDKVAPGTGLALMPLGDGILKLYAETDQITQESTKNGISAWQAVTSLVTKTEVAKQFSAIPIKNRNQVFGDIFVTSLFPNGTVSGQWCQDSKWGSTSLPRISGSETRNFTAIATNQDQRFYGISGGQIHEYTIDGQIPLNWNYNGVILS
ncbi:hypothetical protein HYALB_00005423 [Hymenoscyphus albidus]|uniref:Fucose-specific lectin n=1 Tax=Hymenoscyphus albidus TaxID=595503 RepID=A0A9N9LF77_9HELO|nr:hypothetical protein HYALB_00005423 [Hymenoscyphus albidus]